MVYQKSFLFYEFPIENSVTLARFKIAITLLKYTEILIKLRKIIRSINLESKKIEKEFGVSIPQLLVLQYLSEQEGYRAYAKDIKNYINLNASTVSGIISRLELKGYAARLPQPDDKRAHYVTLTAKGAELLEKSPTTLQEKSVQQA